MYVRAYLRASTKEQDAERAREQVESFAQERGLTIAAFYVENESGASLKRPELFRLLKDSKPGDILLVEQVDRLSRLNAEDWDSLKRMITDRGVRVVALDLPTSWMMMRSDDELTARMMDALNSMMLDMLAAIARKDFADRRRRQAQGIKKAKAEGKYRGRPADSERHQVIAEMIDKGMSWSQVTKATGASRSTISRVLNDRRVTITE
ncbi:recombinase family protein [Marinobacter sp. SS13-12]|uniref:recombinase family protein n=1 Tax=Marinobacter sp. SS13-12 TaxID=3050451 RepID=UPI00255621A2|nr:recombinase family protein [Marinobacter sp. SS13-12]MDK8465009.1 recombinase family protein [Marinobacter sp. SS13-12]